jgi:hypothetical protein
MEESNQCRAPADACGCSCHAATPHPPTRRHREWLTPLAGGAAAVSACAACCLAPAIVPALGALLTTSIIARLQWWSPYLASGATVLVLTGWLRLWHQRGNADPVTRRQRLAAMLVATLLTLTAIFWDHLEPTLLKWTS